MWNLSAFLFTVIFYTLGRKIKTAKAKGFSGLHAFY